eukprot:PhM_4_TR5284/c2_g1_i6/m.34550
MDLTGHCDTFVDVFYPPDSQMAVHRTATKSGTADPVWEESVTLKADGKNGTCRLVLYDSDVTTNDKIGEVIVNISNGHKLLPHEVQLVKANSDQTQSHPTLFTSVVVGAGGGSLGEPSSPSVAVSLLAKDGPSMHASVAMASPAASVIGCLRAHKGASITLQIHAGEQLAKCDIAGQSDGYVKVFYPPT